MKKSIQFFVVLLSAIQVFALTPHINKGKLIELTLEQAVKELQLSQKELQDINKEFYGVLEFNSNFPPVQEADFDSEVHIFKQTFKETNEIIYRVISRTKETAPFNRTGIFQKGYYTNGHGKPNLIFADFYNTEAETFGQSVTSVRLNYNFMPVIKKNKIAGIMIYGIERFDKENSIMEYTGSTQNLYHKAAVYWSDDFSTANLRNEYSNDPDIHIECSKPLIDEKDTFKYTIQNAFDKNPATSYVEDTDDNLIWINLGSVGDLEKIALINGYALNESFYLANNRVKKIICASFVDKITKKIYNEEYILRDEYFTYQFFKRKKIKNQISSKSFKVLEIYRGSKYNNTCIAEIDYLLRKNTWLFGGVE
ncbi:hypothetical protein HMPREF1221_00370 [Treponema socranskii subsp. paredis ATCC 35535]|nr:hypothetical protein HMPREF1221_00370 [Treponema socranskii subsp. paredis ATCC 35535]